MDNACSNFTSSSNTTQSGLVRLVPMPLQPRADIEMLIARMGRRRAARGIMQPLDALGADVRQGIFVADMVAPRRMDDDVRTDDIGQTVQPADGHGVERVRQGVDDALAEAAIPLHGGYAGDVGRQREGTVGQQHVVDIEKNRVRHGGTTHPTMMAASVPDANLLIVFPRLLVDHGQREDALPDVGELDGRVAPAIDADIRTASALRCPEAFKASVAVTIKMQRAVTAAAPNTHAIVEEDELCPVDRHFG